MRGAVVMIDEVAAEVLAGVITSVGRRVGTLAWSVSRHRGASDVSIARWFETYRLTERMPGLAGLAPDTAARLAEVLSGDQVQAVLHELLAARLTDAPENDVNRVRGLFRLALNAAGPGLARYEVTLFDYYDGEICALTARLEAAEPGLLPQIRQEAFGVRMIAILHAIERHTAVFEDQPDLRAEADFLARYRHHVAEHHGQIEPPDFDRRRRVPIAHIYVAPELIQERGDAPDRTLRLYDLSREIDRAVLLGGPGAGKTTAAGVLMHEHAADPRRRVPFLVTLREFAIHHPPERSVAGYIEHKLDTFYQCQAPRGMVSRLLLTGAALVVFDGLDELLDTSHRAEVTATVERFCTEYPLTAVLVTSRLVGYEQARLDDRQFARYRIGALRQHQVSEYVRKWFALDESLPAADSEQSARAFMNESAGVPDLRANPLVLALMCILYRGEGSLPRNRADVYEQCANLLFRRWDAQRHIHVSMQAGHLLNPVLRHLAWWLFTRNDTQPSVTQRVLVTQTAGFLRDRGFEMEDQAREAAAEFVDFCRGRMWVLAETGTTADGEPLYSFTHRTFLEYFAAAHLAYRYDTPEELAGELAPHLARDEWEVLGELAIQIKDHISDRGAERVYAALLTECSHHYSNKASALILQFLGRRLQSADPPSKIVRMLTRQVLDHLFSGDTNDEIRYQPLCTLLASCARRRSLVGEEIAARIAALAASDDPDTKLGGLRLAAHLPVGLTALRYLSDRMAASDEMRQFWQEFRDQEVGTYAAEIKAVAGASSEMRVVALTAGFITLDEALDLPDPLTPLLQESRTGIFDFPALPYLVRKVRTLKRKTLDPPPAETLEDLAAVGNHIIRSQGPPWITVLGDISDVFWLGNKGGAQNLNKQQIEVQAAYLGAAVIALGSIESQHKLRYGTSDRFGVLDKLFPYAAYRYGDSRADLPDLPIPEKFQSIFRDWAHRKVNFTRRPAPAGDQQA
jgi:NACHT domain